MNIKKYTIFFLLVVLFLPSGVFAVSFPELPDGFEVLNVGNFATSIVDPIFNFLWPIFAAFAVVMLIYAAFLYLSRKTSEANKALLWAMVGIAVGILAFSIPFIINSALGF